MNFWKSPFRRRHKVLFSSERRHPDSECSSIVAVALSPNGQTLVTGNTDGQISLWDIATLSKQKVIDDLRSAIRVVRISPDGIYIACVTDRNEFLVWDSENCRRIHVSDGFFDIAFSWNGKRVATLTNDSIINVHEVGSFEKIRALRGDKSVTLSPDGESLVTTNFLQSMQSDQMEIVLCNVDSGIGKALKQACWVNTLSHSPSGKYLACALKDGISIVDPYGVVVWRLPDYECIQPLLRHDETDQFDAVSDVAFTPNGKHMVSSSTNGTIMVWRVGSFERVQTLTWDGAKIASVSVSSKALAVAAKGKGFSLWNDASSKNWE